MDPILVLPLIAVVLVLLVWQWRRRGAADSRGNNSRAPRGEALDTVIGWPPEVTRVLTVPERRAHGLLTQALPDHLVLAQVPVSRFIRVPTRNSYQEWMRRVGQLCADLVVCDTASQVIAVVEVRRAAPKESERSRKRHDRMDRVLRKAGIRVIEWDEEALPHPDAVREQVLPTPQTPAPGPASAARPAALPAGAAAAGAFAATVHAVARPAQADDFDHTDPLTGSVEPTPSTWFDELDSSPMPLDDRPRR